jgi:hypothetical protein
MRPLLRRSIGALLAIGVIVTGAPSAATRNGDARGGAPVAPRLLSETGLYAKGGRLVVDPRNRPYSPQYPLWSDGAQKQRWVHLPPGAPIDVTNVDAWVFPAGTKFWKEFVFNGRRVETRLLWRASEQGWVFASYKWNEEQTDAAIAPADGDIGVAEIISNRRHTIPSVEECRACHDSKRTEILGFSALQLSTDRDPNAIHGEPLTPGMLTLKTLMDDGVLRPRRSDLIAQPPRIRADNPRARAVLGFLSTNCGMCHNREGSLAPLGMLLKQPSGRVRRTLGPRRAERRDRDNRRPCQRMADPRRGQQHQRPHRAGLAGSERAAISHEIAAAIFTDAAAWDRAARSRRDRSCDQMDQ